MITINVFEDLKRRMAEEHNPTPHRDPAKRSVATGEPPVKKQDSVVTSRVFLVGGNK